MPLVALLAACAPAPAPADSAPWAADGVALRRTAAVASAYVTAAAPALGRAWLPVLALDPACPVVTTEGATSTWAGGCTDAAGTTWEGTLTQVVSGDAEVLGWAAWSVSSPTLTLALDGVQRVHWSEDGWSVEGGALTLSVLGVTMPDVPQPLEAAYALHRVVLGPGALLPTEVEGEAEVGAALSWTGRAPSGPGCDVENADGSFAFVGDGTAVVQFDGARACDGEVGWLGDDGDGGRFSLGTTAG